MKNSFAKGANTHCSLSLLFSKVGTKTLRYTLSRLVALMVNYSLSWLLVITITIMAEDNNTNTISTDENILDSLVTELGSLLKSPLPF